MLQEMQIRNYSDRSIRSLHYIHCLSRLSIYYNCSPDLLSIEQVKSYLHYCITERHEATSTLNQIISAVRILFVDVLQRPWEPLKLKRPRRDKKLPVVFSKQEITTFLSGIRNMKHRAIFITAYSCGLRISEVRMLKPGDIDSDRMQIRVASGKGKKDRFTLLSVKTLEELRFVMVLKEPCLTTVLQANGCNQAGNFYWSYLKRKISPRKKVNPKELNDTKNKRPIISLWTTITLTKTGFKLNLPRITPDCL